MICLLVLLGSAIYPKTIYDLFEKIIALQPESAARFSDSRENLLNTLFLIEFAFIGIVFVSCIFMSHKIAGPIYKLKKYLSEVREGGANYPLRFRKGDNFTDLAEEVNQTIQYLKEKRKEELEYLDEIIIYLDNIALAVPQDKKPVLDEITRKLKSMSETP